MASRLAERWYARLSSLLSHQLRGRQPLILYASGPHFRQTNAIEGELGEGTGGVTEAAKRRIVLRTAHPGDGRGVHLALSAAGRRMYAGLIRAAAERDAAFRGCLSKAEHQVFDRALAKLAGRARAFIQREKG